MGHANNAPKSLVLLTVCTPNLVIMQRANVVELSAAHVATLKECFVSSILEVPIKDVCIFKPRDYNPPRVMS